MHFRGPLQLKQFAVYTPSTSSSKAKRDAHVRRHAHAHGHAHQHHVRAAEANAEAQVGAVVTATIDGQVVSWTNEYTGQSSTATPAAAKSSAPAVNVDYAAPASSSAAASAAAASSAEHSSTPSSSDTSAPSPSASSASGSISSSSGGWGRQAYYNSAGTSNGVVFLNHQGGSGSGTFDYAFGNSLSYSNANGTGCASNPTALGDVTLPSDAEVVIMTDKKCSGDDCGYSRDGTEAYHVCRPGLSVNIGVKTDILLRDSTARKKPFSSSSRCQTPARPAPTSTFR